MTHRRFLVSMVFIALLIFSGCPNKDETSKGEKAFEKLSNSMKKAIEELDQIVTLLGGPMFNGRDGIEQLKNQQIQALIKEFSKDKENSSTGMEDTGKSKTGKPDQSPEEEGNDSKEKEQGAQNKDEAGKNGESKDGEGSKDAKNSESVGKEENKNTQDDNSAKEFETQQPASEQEKSRPFQFEDSLFGIPQWQNDNWKMIQVLSDGMYFTWNSIQPELLEKGVSFTQIENFSTALADLSKAIKDKNIKNAQIASFQLTHTNADFASYYKTNIPSDVQRLKSTVTGIHFYVKQTNWEKSQDLAMQLQQELSKLKSNVEDNKSFVFQMLEISIADLKKSIQNQDPALVLLRTNLVTANICELEAELSQVMGQ